MEINKFKIDNIGKRGGLDIWLVDGKKIRDELDIEFTNFGQHFHFSYIPENEFWLDVEAKQDERNFFIDHLLVEHKLMSEGISYEDAITTADEEESKERKKAEYSRRVLDSKGRIILDKIHKKFLGKTDAEINVWLVDGKVIRNNFDIDFTEGGHDLVYDFVPEKEIWLDNDLVPGEIPYVLLHELHERTLMGKGFNYNDAHGGKGEVRGASEIEWDARHNNEKLKGYLLDLGWKN